MPMIVGVMMLILYVCKRCMGPSMIYCFNLSFYEIKSLVKEKVVLCFGPELNLNLMIATTPNNISMTLYSMY